MRKGELKVYYGLLFGTIIVVLLIAGYLSFRPGRNEIFVVLTIVALALWIVRANWKRIRERRNGRP